MAETEDLGAWLDALEPDVIVETFGEGDAAFEVELRRTGKKELERLYQQSFKEKRGGEKLQDVPKFRKGLRDLTLVGWSGLTYRKVALATSRDTSHLNGLGDADVAFTPSNALTMIERARGIYEGEPTSFEDFLFKVATRIADAAAREERASGEG